MTRKEFLNKYEGRCWIGMSGEERFYLNLELALPARTMSRKIKSCRLWLDCNNVLKNQGLEYERRYMAQVIADAESIVN